MVYCYQKHAIKYCEKLNEKLGKNIIWSIKNSGEVLDKLKLGISTRQVCLHMTFSFYTTLLHDLIKEKLIDFIDKNLPKRRLSLPCM